MHGVRKISFRTDTDRFSSIYRKRGGSGARTGTSKPHELNRWLKRQISSFRMQLWILMSGRKCLKAMHTFIPLLGALLFSKNYLHMRSSLHRYISSNIPPKLFDHKHRTQALIFQHEYSTSTDVHNRHTASRSFKMQFNTLILTLLQLTALCATALVFPACK